MKIRVTVFAVERREFKPQGGGTPRISWKCQALVHGLDKQEVGVLTVPESVMEEVAPGDYMAEYTVGVKWDTRDIVGRLSGFERLVNGLPAGAAPVKHEPVKQEAKPQA